MPRFRKREPIVVHADWWDDDENVTIQAPTWGSQQHMIARLMGGLKMDDWGRVDEVLKQREFDVHIVQLAQLEASIVEWTLRDEKGKIVPVTREAINALDPADVQFIQQEVRRLSPQRDANFQGDGGDGSDEPVEPPGGDDASGVGA